MATKAFRLRTFSISSVTWYLSVIPGLSLIGWSLWHVLTSNGLQLAPGFVMTAALIALLELLPLVQGRGHDPQGVVMSTSFVFAMLFLWGLAPAVVLVAIGSLLGDLRQGKAWWKLVFNPSQYALSLGAAWLVPVAAGEHVSLTHPLRTFHLADLAWMAGAWVVYFTVNLVAVGGVLSYVMPLREAVFDDFRHLTMMTFSVLALSPLIVILAQGTWPLIPVLLIPLLMIYYTASLALQREHDAGHDALTGLPNRSTLKFALDDAFTSRQRNGESFALMIIDLDDFKAVNDALGHHAGDELLCEFARRVQTALRPDDLVARLGGDEFAVLAREVDAYEACVVAQRMRESVSEPIEIEGMPIDVHYSVGLALCPTHASDAGTLMRYADVAMFRAKKTRTGLELYSPEYDGNEASRLGLTGELRAALEARQIDLYYQPKVGQFREIIGVEALARWRHPRRGWVPPDEFIPLAERCGLMPLLTAHVIEVAVAQIARWREDGMEVPVAVNVSPLDLVGSKLADLVAAHLVDYGVPAHMLKLEITERVLTDQHEECKYTLDRLRGLGVGISLDDFGTGYSSLMRLSSLPVDEIKIDRAFVANLQDDPRAHGIIRALIGLAHSVGVPAIAEGVETEDEQCLLETMNCDGVQGWHIARPMDAAAATEWLSVHRHGPVVSAPAEVKTIVAAESVREAMTDLANVEMVDVVVPPDEVASVPSIGV